MESALQLFTTPEILDHKNKYRCEKCKKLVKASKRFSIFEAPNILTLQLKRFKKFDSMGFNGGKITKMISYPQTLSLKNYMSEKTHGFSYPVYELYAIVVHAGATSYSGHYYSFVKNSTGAWYYLNDHMVHEVGINQVLNQGAYMLFYKLDANASLQQSLKYSLPLTTPLHPSPPTSNSKSNIQQKQTQNDLKKDVTLNGFAKLNGASDETGTKVPSKFIPQNPKKRNLSEMLGLDQEKNKPKPNLKQENGKGKETEMPLISSWKGWDIDLISQQLHLTREKLNKNWMIESLEKKQANSANANHKQNQELPPHINGKKSKIFHESSLANHTTLTQPHESLFIGKLNGKQVEVENENEYDNESDNLSEESESDNDSAMEEREEEEESSRNRIRQSKPAKSKGGFYHWEETTKRSKNQLQNGTDENGNHEVKPKLDQNQNQNLKSKSDSSTQFDAQVSTWDELQERGAKRKEILESEEFKFVPNKLDEFDMEYDEGKKKKFKNKEKIRRLPFNPFQQQQDQKNQGKLNFD